MKTLLFLLGMGSRPAGVCPVQHGSKEEQQDAKRHRAMAAAHEAAAKCLEVG